MSEAQEIRETVSQAYTRAVESPGTGCCGVAPLEDTKPGCCGVAPTPKGVAVKAAGYRPEELSGLPEDAVTNSFGCGNPVAVSDVQAGQVVLDLGSGAGIDLLLAARKVGPEGRVIGIDMTDAMIARARANAEAAGLTNVEVRKGIIEDLPVEDASVDWVISNCVINLSPEKDKVFAEIARVLRPGGRMVVSDIVVEDFPAWARESAALYCSCLAGAVSEEEYLAGLAAAGLAEPRVTERLVYEVAQLKGLVESELAPAGAGDAGGLSFDELVERVAPELENKVWSARFTARKPD